MIDRKRVERSFHRGASDYDDHTPVQKRVLDKLLDILSKNISAPPDNLLDVGCGTGLLLESLSGKYHDATLSGIDIAPNMLYQAAERLSDRATLLLGDAEKLPFSDSSFNLVLSTSVFQWLEECDACFAEVRRVLMEDGVFCFALFGRGTFYELHESWQLALKHCGRSIPADHDGTHRFHSINDIRSALLKFGFSDVKVKSVSEVVWYEDLPKLLRAIKRVGAGSARPPSGGGLGWRSVLHEMASIYKTRFGTEKGVPASYKVIYGFGRV